LTSPEGQYRLGAILRGDDIVTLVPEDIEKKRAHLRVIVHYQDTSLPGHGHFLLA
jgi:hypothetical protein